MFKIIPVSLHEVMQVKNCPLSEDQLWTILRSLINILADKNDQYTKIRTQDILLFPSGKLSLAEENKSQHTETIFKSKDLALVILDCASYQLNEECPLNMSSTLQTLLTTMCEQQDICTIEHLQEICNHQENLKHLNDASVISEMCSTILGNTDLWYGCEENAILQTKHEVSEDVSSVGTFENSLTRSEYSETTSSGRMSCMFGKLYSLDEPFFIDSNRSDVDRSCNKSKKFHSTHFAQNQKKISEMALTALAPSDLPESVLKSKDVSPTIHIDSETSNNDSFAVIVFFVNYSKVTVVTRNPDTTTTRQIIQSALNVFLKSENTIGEEEVKYFALGTWKDSEFYFFDNTNLRKVFRNFQFASGFTLYLRLLFYPPITDSLNDVLLRSMYIQLRADIIQEQIICSHDDALMLAVLALQCEVGDYKAEYGCKYFLIEEFLSPSVVSKLGIAYIRLEIPVMHSHLRGTSIKEARLFFLKRCLKLNEFGMNFTKTYRVKSCKEEHSTWLGIGPRGILNFDIRGNTTRIKRQQLQWSEMKKIKAKGQKVSLSRLNPSAKMKFYCGDNFRAKYLVNLISKLSRYYTKLDAIFADLSNSSLPHDLTKLSESPIYQSTPENSSLPNNSRSWTYHTPQFTRNTRNVIRRPSSGQSTSRIQKVINKSIDNEFFPPVVTHDKRFQRQAAKPSGTTLELVADELQQVLEDGGSIDTKNTLVEDGDEINETSVDCARQAKVEAIPEKDIQHFLEYNGNNHAVEPSSSVIGEKSFDTYADDIHVTARKFYRNSLTEKT